MLNTKYKVHETPLGNHPARIFKGDHVMTSEVVPMRNENLTPTISADGQVVVHLLTLKCGPPLDKESSREEIKLAERMDSIPKDFEARQLEVGEDEQLEVVEEEEEDWDPQDEQMDVERQLGSGHMILLNIEY
ncbi:unnamed protein product [Heligmosomoides polygyrus]|uniref:Nucleoplasmin domain-containing protein n=1 Tax=Heligmosomoides polygyrus TaxID=6339 RepID=A0A183G7W0_HELPZ|nr:unnamed protein product [Heligmosomoides polygyrus]